MAAGRIDAFIIPKRTASGRFGRNEVSMLNESLDNIVEGIAENYKSPEIFFTKREGKASDVQCATCQV